MAFWASRLRMVHRRMLSSGPGLVSYRRIALPPSLHSPCTPEAVREWSSDTPRKRSRQQEVQATTGAGTARQRTSRSWSSYSAQPFKAEFTAFTRQSTVTWFSASLRDLDCQGVWVAVNCGVGVAAMFPGKVRPWLPHELMKTRLAPNSSSAATRARASTGTLVPRSSVGNVRMISREIVSPSDSEIVLVEALQCAYDAHSTVFIRSEVTKPTPVRRPRSSEAHRRRRSRFLGFVRKDHVRCNERASVDPYGAPGTLNAAPPVDQPVSMPRLCSPITRHHHRDKTQRMSVSGNLGFAHVLGCMPQGIPGSSRYGGQCPCDDGDAAGLTMLPVEMHR